MDELAALRVFVNVVQSGRLSAAGRNLGLAPSSVSRRISELEDSLGVALLHRTTRKLSLTEAGTAFYERSREIVRAIEEAKLSVKEGRDDPTGTLRLTLPASLARLYLVPAVAAFQQQHPKVRVSIGVTDRLMNIVDEGIDLAIRIGALQDSSLIARRVGVGRRLVCASRAYLERAGEPRHPKQLSAHDCLTFRTYPGTNIWRFRDADEVVEVRANGPLVADHGEALVSAARAGLGLVLVPEWLVAAEIPRGRLVEVLSSFTADSPHTPVFAVYPSGPYTPLKVRAFVNFLAKRFAGDAPWTLRA